MTQRFIDRKFQKVAETFAAADPRDLGLLAALCKAHIRAVSAEAARLADSEISSVSVHETDEGAEYVAR